MPETDEMQRFTLRVPVELLIEVKVMAARARRSLNSQVISILEEATRKNQKAGEAA